MSRTLCVANLPPTMEPGELRQLFAHAGQVASLVIMRDDISGVHRSVAYIEMHSDDGARAAIARFNDYVYGERTLDVSERG